LESARPLTKGFTLIASFSPPLNGLLHVSLHLESQTEPIYGCSSLPTSLPDVHLCHFYISPGHKSVWLLL
jgi:hypothetical protein